MTPSSTPPNEAEEEEEAEKVEKKEEGDSKSTNLNELFSELSEVALHDKIYDK